MWVEKDPLVGQLEKKFFGLGIKGLLFDADDTLFLTSEFMRKHRLNFCVWAAERLGVELLTVRAVFEQAALDSTKVLCVTPERWDLAVRLTAEKLTGDKSVLDEGIEIIKQLFFDSPELIGGVKPMLELLTQTRVKMGIVTHSPTKSPWRKWTWLKLQRNGIVDYFSNVWIADDTKEKDREAWEGGAAMLGLSPENILGFGDNVEADILPMKEVGMRAIALKPRRMWKTNIELPVDVPLLDDLTEAPEAILSLE